MKSAYLLAGIQIRIFLQMIRSNKISLWPKYIFRLLFVLQNALWASLFAWREKQKYGKQIANYEMPVDPVFIIGHWRTGSTFLHQLMNLDENLAAPTLFQTAQPNGFKSAYRYFRPLMKVALGKTRPFDQIKNSMDEPQEDEFALVRLTGFSPMLGLVFPKRKVFFLNDYSSFLPAADNELTEWKKQTKAYYNKLAWNSQKQLVLKNPFHSFRIKELIEMYPRAKFIHIYRNPLDVVPSTVKMWSIVGSQNTMNRLWKNPEIPDVIEILNSLLEQVENDKLIIPKGAFTEIKFEDMEKDVISTLKKVYKDIGLEFSEVFEKRLLTFLEENKDYEKNRYSLQTEEKALILQKLQPHFRRLEYDTDEKN
jgi:omega-hydroxy-beta-dihydromenaquinone-9 sulfotransferase